MALLGVVTRDWWVWETRLWETTGRDPLTLSARQLVSLVYGILAKDRDPQQREVLDAALEDRIAMSLTTGKAYGLESDDPDVRHQTKLALLERARREHGR